MDCRAAEPGGIKVSRFWFIYYSHKNLCRVAGMALAALAASLLLVDLALANPITDFFFGDPIKDLTNSILSAASDNFNAISILSITNSFDELFEGTNAYKTMMDVQASLVKSLAYAILTIVILVQLVRIANRLDGAAAVPGVKEVIFLLIFFVVIKFVIDHSVEFCAAFYDGTVSFIKNMPSFDASPDAGWEMTADKLGLTGAGGCFLALLVILPVSAIALVVGYFVVIARNLQIYIYAVFACIPLALLGAEETKQYGMGFIKNYVALCLTGIIIVLILIMYPLLTQSVVNANEAGIGVAAQQIAVSALFIFAMMKSGGWAREILGG